MTDFFITNKGTVHGGTGEDRLSVTNTIPNEGVWLSPLTDAGGGIDKVTGGLGVDIWAADKSFATTALNINLNKAASHYLGSGVVRGGRGNPS